MDPKKGFGVLLWLSIDMNNETWSCFLFVCLFSFKNWSF